MAFITVFSIQSQFAENGTELAAYCFGSLIAIALAAELRCPIIPGAIPTNALVTTKHDKQQRLSAERGVQLCHEVRWLFALPYRLGSRTRR
jgi:hypothetical protein